MKPALRTTRPMDAEFLGNLRSLGNSSFQRHLAACPAARHGLAAFKSFRTPCLSFSGDKFGKEDELITTFAVISCLMCFTFLTKRVHL